MRKRAKGRRRDESCPEFARTPRPAAFSLLAALFVGWGPVPRQSTPCELELLLQGNQPGATVENFLGFGIDDAGTVVLSGSDSSGSRLFAVTGPGAITPLTPEAHGTFAALVATTRALPSKTHVRREEGGEDFIEGWDTATPMSVDVLASSPDDFDQASPGIDANESGKIVFWAHESGMVELRVGPPFETLHMDVPGLQQLFPPALADDGTVVFKNSNGDLLKLSPTGPTTTSTTLVAGLSTGFSPAPGIPLVSGEGNVTVFTGNRGLGLGLFASVETGSGEVLLHLAGEGQDALGTSSGLDLKDIVQLPSVTPGGIELQVILHANEGTGRGLYLGRYSIDVEASGASVGASCLARVTGVDGVVAGLRITTLTGSAKLNRSGQYVFSAGLEDGTNGLIRGRVPELPMVPDPLAPGSHAVGRLPDFNEANVVVAGGSYPGIPAIGLEKDGSEISGFGVTGQDALPGFDLSGRIAYPASMPGVNVPVAAGGPFPLVVIAHGNHAPYSGASLASHLGRLPDPSDENYRGHGPLQARLASHGFISVSIDLDDFVALFPGIQARAWLVLCHIERMEALNALPGPLVGQIDLGRIALVGHSRGGEAVVVAQRMNAIVGGIDGGPAVGPGPGEGIWPIQAVWSLAATRFFDGTVNWDLFAPVRSVVPVSVPAGETPFLGMWGSADGDVNGADSVPSLGLTWKANHVQGIYDGAAGAKQLVWIEGANHNFWNSSWFHDLGLGRHLGDDGAGALPPELRRTPREQEILAEAYGLAFLRGNVLGETSFLQYFGHAAHELPPVAVAVRTVHLQHRARPAERRIVDDFESNPSLTTTSQGAMGVDVLTLAGISELELTGGFMSTPVATRDWYHDTTAALMGWDARTDYYETVLPPGGQDVSGFDVLSFRIGQGLADPASIQDLVVRVELRDLLGEIASVNTCRIPAPQLVLPPALPKSLLKTFRIPLCEFHRSNDALDLTAIRAVRFVFGHRVSGQVAIDDIEFSD